MIDDLLAAVHLKYFVVQNLYLWSIYAREPLFMYTRDARYTQKTGFLGLYTTRIFTEEKIRENN